MATDGTIGIAGQQFRDDQLDNLFRAVFAHDKRTQVVLKVELKTRDPGARFTGRASNLFLTHVRHEVDKGVAHRRVVNLMERAKAAGLTRFAIGTSGGT